MQTLEIKPPERIIRMKEACHITGLSHVTIWRYEKAGRFPKRRRLAPTGIVGWLLSEVHEWMQQLEVVAPAEKEMSHDA